MQKGWRYALREKLTNANTKFPHSAITAAVLGKWQNWFLDLRSLPPGVFAFPSLPESLEDAVIASLVDGLMMLRIDGSGRSMIPLRLDRSRFATGTDTPS